ADPLRMRQVARVVVRDAQRERMAGRPWRTALGYDLCDISPRRGKGAGPRGPRRIVGEQLAVFLHRRSAAGGVDRDPLDAGGLEELYGATGERARLAGPAGG